MLWIRSRQVYTLFMFQMMGVIKPVTFCKIINGIANFLHIILNGHMLLKLNVESSLDCNCNMCQLWIKAGPNDLPITTTVTVSC